MNDQPILGPESNGKTPQQQRWEWKAAFWFRVLSFPFGVAILTGQAFGLADPRPSITAGGIGLCGPVVAAAAGSFFETIRGGK